MKLTEKKHKLKVSFNFNKSKQNHKKIKTIKLMYKKKLFIYFEKII